MGCQIPLGRRSGSGGRIEILSRHDQFLYQIQSSRICLTNDIADFGLDPIGNELMVALIPGRGGINTRASPREAAGEEHTLPTATEWV